MRFSVYFVRIPVLSVKNLILGKILSVKNISIQEKLILQLTFHLGLALNPGGGGTPYNGLYGEALPERGTFFTLQVYERVGISQVKVYKRVGKSIIYLIMGN